MSDSLVVDCDRYCYRWRIFWVLDGEEGATLGETTYTAAQLANAKPEDWEHIAATVAVSETDGVQHHPTFGYFWDSRAGATKALQAARAVIRDKSRKPWPEWAVKAAASGWKAPKGWTP